ncbi:MAG: alpha/beta hydrolase [Actinomycetota bacterium]
MSETLGFDEAGSGSVLLLVHGFPLDRTMWAAQLTGLSDIRRVVALDLPGRGKSEGVKDDAWTIDGYADEVARLVDELGVDQVDLAGLSMGGYVAFAFLRRHTAKVRSLILVDTKAADDPAEAKEGRVNTAALVREKGTVELVGGLLPKLTAPNADEAVISSARKMFENTPGETAACDALAMKDRVDSTPALATIEIPTLVLHGAEDQLMPVAGAEEMASKIPGAKFVSIANGGHLSPMENPTAVNKAIREFLTG